MAKFWYSYNGIDDPLLASSYDRPSVPFTPPCSTGDSICAIYANGSFSSFSPDNPLSVNLHDYIILALASSTPKPNGPINYVLKRDND